MKRRGMPDMRRTATGNPVLVIDDEPYILESIRGALNSVGITDVITCSDSRKALGLLESTPCSVVILDLTMPHLAGTELLPLIQKAHPGLPVIIVTGINEVETAVECMRQGAFDYLVKAISNAELSASVKRAIEFVSLTDENLVLKNKILFPSIQNSRAFEAIITRSPAMEAVFRYTETVAPTGRTILVTGQTGTGKELLAEAIHTLSGREGPLVKVNVAGLDDTMFTDALFGHRKGAYSGADEVRKGLVESASDGTLFLDEIGDLQPQTQVKLLRLIDNGEYYQLGSDVLKKANCRIVAATNKTLEHLAGSGTFRSDLYYRLASHSIELPPLGERAGDIPMLFNHFLTEACVEFGKTEPEVADEVYTALEASTFPGNIRELKSLVFDCVGRMTGPAFSLSELPPRIRNEAPGQPAKAESGNRGDAHKLAFPEVLPTLHEVSELLIRESLQRTGGNISAAARLLGVTQSALSKRLSRAVESNKELLTDI
jgi:DNA-binding NtrC family response regulator